MKAKIIALLLCVGMVVSCNNTGKGAAIGAGGGAVLGGVIGALAGNTMVGAAIGGAVGAGTGASSVAVWTRPRRKLRLPCRSRLRWSL